MDIKKCLIGRLIDTQCGDHQFVKNQINVKDLSDIDKKNLKYRVINFPAEPVGFICRHHRVTLIDQYLLYQTRCFDPFDRHKDTVRKSLREISLEVCENFNAATSIIIPPGNKVCTNCLKSINEELTKQDEINEEEKVLPNDEDKHDTQSSSFDNDSEGGNCNNSSDQPSSSDSSLGFLPESQEQKKKEDKLKRILDEVDLPMPKRQKLYGKQLEKVSADLTQSVNKRVLNQINDTFQTKVDVVDTKKLERDKQSLDSMILCIKSLYETKTTHYEKIKVLTLFPSNWTYDDVKKRVDCSSYLLRRANLLREKHGIMAGPGRKKMVRYSEDLVGSIEEFYRNNSRICSDAKEVVSVKNRKTKEKEKLPKKLLLYTIKELYHKYIQVHMQDLEKVPGFSYFASIRPNDIKLAGDPGTHTVCVCGEHQNVKLKCRACSITLEYRKLLEISVCSVEEENCMLSECPNCPGPQAIREYLESQQLIKTNGNIRYFNWLSVKVDSKNNDEAQICSRVTLREVNEDAQTFYNQFIEDIWNLRKHHFVMINFP